MSDEYVNTNIRNSSDRFPQKLWKIINECQNGAVRWSSDGQTVILNCRQFQEEYLNSSDSCFKTSNVASFIRQLNLYGFKKISQSRQPLTGIQNDIRRSANIHVFSHDNFRWGRLDLLPRVCRKTTTKKCKKIFKFEAEKPIKFNKLQRCRVSYCARFLTNSFFHFFYFFVLQLNLKNALEEATQDFLKEKFKDSIYCKNSICDEIEGIKSQTSYTSFFKTQLFPRN